MATLAELQARRESLIKKRESLVTRVTTGERTVQFDLTQTDAAIRALDDDIATAQSTTHTRQVRIYSEKGL